MISISLRLWYIWKMQGRKELHKQNQLRKKGRDAINRVSSFFYFSQDG